MRVEGSGLVKRLGSFLIGVCTGCDVFNTKCDSAGASNLYSKNLTGRSWPGEGYHAACSCQGIAIAALTRPEPCMVRR